VRFDFHNIRRLFRRDFAGGGKWFRSQDRFPRYSFPAACRFACLQRTIDLLTPSSALATRGLAPSCTIEKPTRMVWRESRRQLPKATSQFLLGFHDKVNPFLG
jgi:hypothetical protein